MGKITAEEADHILREWVTKGVKDAFATIISRAGFTAQRVVDDFGRETVDYVKGVTIGK